MKTHDDALETPLRWYDVSAATTHRARLPFAELFMIDPSENPTVRPVKSGAIPDAPPPDLLEGEDGLIVIARRRIPVV